MNVEIAGYNEQRLAVRLQNVSKVYKLYDSRRAQLLHSLGIAKFLPGVRLNPTREFTALNEVSFDLPAGERLGIVGRNGAGKTTLLKLITGNFSPTSGEITVNGTVQALMQMGLGFHPEFTGYENIRSALNYSGLTDIPLSDAIDDVVEFVELGNFLHQPFKTYSLGMQARVQFAAATAIRPDILIVDEILGAGDAYFSGKSAHRMEKLANSGCTLLLVSHSTAQILQFCKRAIWIENGSIREYGEALEIVKSYEKHIASLSTELNSKSSTKMDLDINSLGTPLEDDYEPAEWQRQRFLDLLGEHRDTSHSFNDVISRWPGEPGLMVSKVKLIDANSNTTREAYQGQPITFDIEIASLRTGVYDFRIALLIMTLDGIGITRNLSEHYTHEFTATEKVNVHLRYAPCLLASGEFVFSVGLYKKYDPDDASTAIRYEILSRSFKFKVLPKVKSEPAIFHHPAEWYLIYERR